MSQPKKISVICALYIGDRPVQVDNIIEDKLYYYKKQLEYFSKYKDEIHKFYFITTFQKEEYIKYLYEMQLNTQADTKIEIICKANFGGSYTSWKKGLEIDNGQSDLIFLVEDDYVINSVSSIKTIVDDFEKDPDLFYYCGLWRDNHAAISNGIINNKMFIQSKLKFATIDNKITRKTLFDNQKSYLEPFRTIGYKMEDYKEKYSSGFSNGVNNINEYGVEGGTIIFEPLTITE